ncbi:MAG: DUF3552 domain-containing protein [Candidatus Parcubacteria bacterium]|nr:DUF3552 domain-containing protein [Candidatus Paceibacterota bacterium]
MSNILYIMFGVILVLFVICFALLIQYYNKSQNPDPKKFSNLIDQLAQKEAAQKVREIRAEIADNLEKSYQEKKQSFQEEFTVKNNLTLETERLKINNQAQLEQDKNQQRLIDLQEQITKKETQVDQKLTELNLQKEFNTARQEELQGQKESLDELIAANQTKQKQIQTELEQKLEEVAGIPLQEARTRIISQAQEEMGEELLDWQSKYLTNYESQAMTKAREITVLAIQRCSSEVANEFTITVVKLPSDDDKGKLIGKGGRNIQWLEKTLGVELVIDDTQGAVTVSGFSSIRRHIAKKTIEKLLEDGRVHPASIEEMHEKAKNEMAQEIYEAGLWATNELKIYDFADGLIHLLGRLKFRTSYGQNMLKHSVEMAKLAGLLTDGINTEFGMAGRLDRMIAVKGALLHDIGKAADEEMNPKGNHIEIGEKICDMYDLDWRIKKCITSHHTTGGDWQSYHDASRDQVCLEAAIVDACDSLSGGRPGARKETVEAYIQRLESLENLAKKVPGVTKAWVMRAATEIWVFFDAESMSPTQVFRATRKLARDIHNSVTTPKEVKVIGFREDRIVEYSR